jgi:XTP/dITP diphosphohydrolase
LADDTGLEVDALHGAPGVYSARYSGPGATYESNCKKLLNELRSIPAEKRTARFRTVIALKTHDALYAVEGKLEGRISHVMRGQQGFGYDPLFETENGQTLAELTSAEKNVLSHRAKALERMIALLNWLTRSGA